MRKNLLLFFLSLLTFFSVAADNYYDFKDGGIYYKYCYWDVWHKPIAVEVAPQFESNISAGEFARSYSGSVTIPQYAESEDYGQMPVIGIGNYAFDGCTELTSVTLHDGIQYIGKRAFYGCTNLKKSYIRESVTSIGFQAFENCTSLTSMTIAGTDVEISNQAFRGCTNLTTVTFEHSLINIGWRTFEDCPNLVSVTFCGDVGAAYGFLFNGCSKLKSVTLKNCRVCEDVFSGSGVESVKLPDAYLAEYALRGCEYLTEVDFDNTAITVGKNGLSGNTSLTELYIPGGKIREYAFSDCPQLKTINFGDLNLILEDNAFKDQTGITTLTFGTGVSSIGVSAFEGCTGLTTIDLPYAPFTVIPERAFAGCSNLTAVTLHDNVLQIDESAFEKCTSLLSMDIPNSVVTIADKAFYYDSALQTVNISDSVTSIGMFAFANCTDLNSVTFGNSLNYVGTYAFMECNSIPSIVLPDSFVEIGQEAFFDCRGLTSVTLGNYVHTIGPSAFNGCYSLSSINFPNTLQTIDTWGLANTALEWVELPNSVTTLGEGAFTGCSEIWKLILSESLTEIPDYAFKGCTNISVVKIPEGVTSIGSEAFWECTFLQNLDLPASLQTIGYDAFKDCPYSKAVIIHDLEAWLNIDFQIENASDEVEVCYANPFYEAGGYMLLQTGELDEWDYPVQVRIEDLVIPNSVTKIRPYAFMNLDDLASVTFHDGVTEIGKGAFYHCVNLASPIFPESLTKIGAYAFYQNKKLTGDLVIPDNVTEIGKYAFYDIVSYPNWIENISLGKSLATIGDYAFENTWIKSVYNYSDLTVTKWAEDNGLVAYHSYNVYNNLAGRDGDFIFEKSGDNVSLSQYLGSETDVVIPDAFGKKAVTGISANCFKDRTSLLSVTFPENLTTIGSYAFGGCTGLTSLEFPSGLTEICDDAFNGCSGITTANLPELLTTIGISAFYNCSSLLDVKLPNTLTSLGAYAFYGNTSLKNLSFGSGLEFLDQGIFGNCSSLTLLTFPRNINEISACAFQGCSGLSSLEIGCGITWIASFAFDLIPFDSVTVAATTSPTIGDGTFNVASGTPLYVPAGSESSYEWVGRSQPWISAGFTITPMVDITNVTVTGLEEYDELPVNTPIPLSAAIEPAEATLPYIFWRSTNPEMATVDVNGQVTVLPAVSNPTIHKAAPKSQCQIIAETMYADAPQAVILLEGDVSTGIRVVGAEMADTFLPVRSNDIYNMQGVLLKADATQADIDGLAPGVYIIAGRKVLVK